MHIISAVIKSIPSIFTGVFLKKLLQCMLLTLAFLIGFIWLVDTIAESTSLFEKAWLESAFDLFSLAASTILAWFLFPSLLPLITGLFQNTLLNKLEARHYGENAKQQDYSKLSADILFAVKSITINLLILPTLLLFSPLYFVLYCVANSYLLGTEFFRIVADRRTEREKSDALIQKHRISVYSCGLLIALCTLIPVVNLIMPLLAIVIMMHLFYILKGA